MTLVLDASAALAWIYAREKADEAACAERILLEMAETAIIVPALWHIEIANALLTGERRKIITEAQAFDYLARLARLPIVVDNVLLATRHEQIMALARAYKLSAYDATYLELALRTGAALATFDGKLAAAMQGAGGRVFA
ncbi:PIN domain-containing protein [Collimonas pratensis]|nr:type II toxin-antitoxin system VapC family toxin [Collimonas pratensis]NKI71024.1 PIN domain-containing protein [Collimonas pratensis]